MNYSKSTVDAFFALLRAGLWEQGVRLSIYEPLDFDAIFQLSDEQAVVGVIGAGLEHVEDRRVVKKEALPFMKKVFSLEQRNTAMNVFLAGLVGRLQNSGVYTLLIKGQGIAQCYERPLWRTSGDIDLLMNDEDYHKAKKMLIPLSSSVDEEHNDRLHLCLVIESWTVELHGSFRGIFRPRIIRGINDTQNDTFVHRKVRIWRLGKTDILIPSPDNDNILVFTHILQHFFRGGIGLRQICDWCRLLWTYRNEIDQQLLSSRLHDMRLYSEWEVFASLAVEYLGMPREAMPLYKESSSIKRRAELLCGFILQTGNFGQNRDMNYLREKAYLIRKGISLWRVICLTLTRIRIFPVDSFIHFIRYVFSSAEVAIREV